MQSTTQMTDRGMVANFEGVHALFPSDDVAMAATIPAVESLAEHRNTLAETTKEEALPSLTLQSQQGRAALSAVSVTYSALVQRKRDTEAADRRIWERSPTAADDRLDPHWCDLYRSLDPGSQFARIANAKLPELAAIALNPDLAGLGTDPREYAGERYVAMNFAERVGLAGGYPNRPSLEGDVLATGVDEVAVEKAATVALDAHKARVAQSKADEGTMRHVIAMLGAAFGLSEKEVLDRIIP